MKTQVVERLGEKAVLLPTLIGDALAANDRIKLRLSSCRKRVRMRRRRTASRACSATSGRRRVSTPRGSIR